MAVNAELGITQTNAGELHTNTGVTHANAGIVTLDIAGETVELLPERCLYWPKSRALFAADLHWGKAEIFQKSGVAVSSRILDDDLARLTRAIRRTGASRLVVLGDLIHAPAGITNEVVSRIESWRQEHHDLEFDLVRGNHDARFSAPKTWRLRVVERGITEGPFLFVHDLPERAVAAHRDDADQKHLVAGHIHPVVRLRGAGDSLRLPCFATGKSMSLLPAFSAFTGGQELDSRDWQRIFVVTENAVIEV